MTASPAGLPHHDGSPLYVSTQEPVLGEAVSVRLRVPRGFAPLRVVRVRSNPDREPSYADARIVHETPEAVWWQAEVVVENPVHGYRWLLEDREANTWWLTSKGISTVETRDIDDFRLVTFAAPPAWGREQIMYQVFPDRFARSAAADDREAPAWAWPASWGDPVIHQGPGTGEQFYGGDLDGVREHLDHLVDLGVTLLYLTPVFPARSNHRYDALSFDHVDPLLGGDEALVRLVEAAHERGIRVIGDLTTNHSGDAHEWFRASFENPGALESGFYLWLDGAQSDYVSWLGFRSLPKFNWNSPELRARFIEGPDSVVARFLKPPFSFDGWRIDVANMTGRYREEDLNEEVRRTIRRTMVEANPDTLLVGESTNDASGGDFTGDAWHGAMTYANFTRPLWNWLSVPGSPAGGGLGMTLGRTTDYSGLDFYAAHREFAAAFPWRTRLHTMNALDTHDTPRFTTSAREGVVPVAVGLAMTMPGIPVVWAGDEFGLTAADGEQARTPMPWDAAGEYVDEVALYRRLIALKRSHPALNGGGIRWLHVSEEAVAFVREGASECVLVVAARSAGEVDLAGELPDDAEPLEGAAVWGAGLVHVDGPAFLAWRLPGVTLPAW
ncbi:glycoside hydrolase family 13 protein [Protaetiibacter intestinalis]|uniref:Glycoside hydrolase family 13 protein n=1 Tax=Protaetiibacter intestinalis TaxID=2419774 RepID=A0A387B3I7_9MICO|nr:glycoside hydrolase family 13 protein [Protaetiibacter intestinalis]AYF98132.1 glycoside hydrolase family 13 protein [Protaetiibacter intestinalis]